MEKFSAVMAALANLIKSLSFVKLIELVLLIIILVAALTFYENRQLAYDSVGAGALSNYYPTITVSDKVKEEMRVVTERSSKILGLHVAEVNFIKNTRRTIFFVSDDPQLKRNFETYLNTKLTDAPVLTTLEPDNTRIVRLVNGEFVCIPYKDTISPAVVGAADNVGLVCSLSVPPIYGKFRGYISAFVAKGATAVELSQVKFALQDISTKIYDGK